MPFQSASLVPMRNAWRIVMIIYNHGDASPITLSLNWQSRPTGSIIYLRRTSDAGMVKVLGHVLRVDPLWPHRLVRCEVDLDQEQIRCYRLRRREPLQQPLIATLPYTLPRRRFDTRPRHKHPLTPIP